MHIRFVITILCYELQILRQRCRTASRITDGEQNMTPAALKKAPASIAALNLWYFAPS